ncbi:MAG: hypothetical protein ACRD3D_05200 [Terriglobia bacterium]
MTYPDPQLGAHPVTIDSSNFGLGRGSAPSTVLTVSYSGSRGHFIPGGVGHGIYTDRIQPKYLALGTLLTKSATPASLAAANSTSAIRQPGWHDRFSRRPEDLSAIRHDYLLSSPRSASGLAESPPE